MTEERVIEELRTTAALLRQHVVRICARGGCHVGGALSSADIVAALYFHVMKLDPKRPDWDGRDYFILSKGHSCPVLYAALAERGFFPVDELERYQEFESILAGHPTLLTPGVDVPTGSLGHGLSVGIGIALGCRAKGGGNRVFVLMGDGELQEGSVWEAAMAAPHLKLENLVGIIDRNKLQCFGPTEEMMALEPLADKWRNFGWAVRVIDGNDMPQVLDALTSVPAETGKPTLVLAETVKGKGVSFMEGQREWHYGKLTNEQEAAALAEIPHPRQN
ncbi:MAG: transketolase [Planctomycetes bacterium]|nr:transketolase [Planctomycetota bacterium]